MAAGEDNVKREARALRDAKSAWRSAPPDKKSERQRDVDSAARRLSDAHRDYSTSMTKEHHTPRTVVQIAGFDPYL